MALCYFWPDGQKSWNFTLSIPKANWQQSMQENNTFFCQHNFTFFCHKESELFSMVEEWDPFLCPNTIQEESCFHNIFFSCGEAFSSGGPLSNSESNQLESSKKGTAIFGSKNLIFLRSCCYAWKKFSADENSLFPDGKRKSMGKTAQKHDDVATYTHTHTHTHLQIKRVHR